MKKLMRNLTGHNIVIYNYANQITKIIKPDEHYDRLRATCVTDSQDFIGGIPVKRKIFTMDYSDSFLDDLANSTEYLIVSSVCAQVLRARKYKGNILVAGKKRNNEGRLEGVYDLSLFW